GREAAIARQQHAICAEELHGTPRALGDLLDRLHAIVLLVHHADADADVTRQVREHVELAGARRTQLEKERTDVERGQERDQRTVVARQRGLLVPGPVAPADVQPEPRAWQIGDDPIDEPARELELAARVALL